MSFGVQATEPAFLSSRSGYVGEETLISNGTEFISDVLPTLRNAPAERAGTAQQLMRLAVTDEFIVSDGQADLAAFSLREFRERV